MTMKKRSSSDNDSLNRIIRVAVLIRLLMLILIACSGGWEQSFIGQGSDDRKYEVGAELFAQNATSLFDVKTFTWAFNAVDSTDWTGYHLNQPLSSSVVWYLIVTLLVWFTKTKYSIRLLNIFLAIGSLKYIYNFADKIWGKEVALKSVKLYAVLPYPVIFCCFGYKEELAMFCTFYLLSHSIDFRMGEKITFLPVIKMILVALTLLGIRSGISLIFLALCLAIIFFPNLKTNLKFSVKKAVPFLVMFMIGIFAFARYGETISYKANIYLGGSRGDGDTISVLMINSISDIWKLPFSYMFSIIMPINLFENLDSWVSIINTVNICMVPISVGCALYLIMIKKPDKIVYWGTLTYYLIYVISSLNIFRQYASLLPLNLIYFSAFTVNANKSMKQLMYILSGIMALTLVIFYML